jgi:hypothetical protein
MAGGCAGQWETHPRATLSPSHLSSGMKDTPETAPEKQYANVAYDCYHHWNVASWLLPGQGDVLLLKVVFSCW